MLCNKRSHHDEKPSYCNWRIAPIHHSSRKPACSNEDPGQQNIYIYFKIYIFKKYIKNLPANAGDLKDAGSIPVSGRSSGGGGGNPFQYSCLENPTDRGDLRATVQRVTNSRTQLSTWISKYLKEFSILLYMRRWKRLSSLNSFLSYASQLSGASFLFCFVFHILSHCREWQLAAAVSKA